MTSRCDYYSDDEYNQACQREQEQNRRQREQEQAEKQQEQEEYEKQRLKEHNK